MSYINEALKKAQELKDSGYSKYYDIPLSGDIENRRSRTRIFYYSASVLVLILLIFSGYGWLYFLHDKGKTATDARGKVPSASTDAALDKKDLYDKAMSLYNQGRINDAKKLYEAVVALDPGYIEALNNLGIIYIRENDFDAAEDCLKKAVRLNQSYVESYYNLACLYAIKGDIDRGLDHLERAISLNGEVREWAESDSDLQALRSTERFKKIIHFLPIP